MKKFFYSLILLFTLFPSIAFGAVAFVAKSSNITGANNTSGTVDCTGANFLVVTLNTSDSAATVTYNSVSMTKSVSRLTNSSNTTYIFTLANPSTGVNTIAITKTDGGSRAQGVCYSGVDHIDATANGVATVGGAGNTTINLTVVDTGCWVVAGGENTTAAPDGGVIVTTNRSSTALWANGTTADSGATVSSGVNAVGYHQPGADTMDIVAMSLSPNAPATPVTLHPINLLTLFGEW